MGKIDTLQKYIDACDEIKSHSENEKDKLCLLYTSDAADEL